MVVDVESARAATGLSYFVLFRQDDVDPTKAAPLADPQIVGEYRDAFVLSPDGWRIAHRTASAGFVRRVTPPRAGA
jgi:hypothetical protein